MDLQFRRELVPYLKTVINETQSQEQTQEVRLPDGMPDIGRVVSSWGQVLIRSKEWRAGGVGISGGVMVWVMYLPEDSLKPQCVETWLPFQMKWAFEAPEQDGSICVIPLLSGVDARSISARKLMVRTSVDVHLHAKVRSASEIYLPEELPDGVCVLKHTYPMELPSESGEKAFSLEEELEFPASVAKPDKLVYYSVWPQVTDRKMLTDKLLFRGVLRLRVLYLDADGALCTWGTEVPFSQYTDLDREYNDEARSMLYTVVTNLEFDKNQDEKFVLKVGLLAQYTICDRTDVTIVEDAYSTKCQLIPEVETVCLPAILDGTVEKVVVRPAPEMLAEPIMDMSFYPMAPQVYRDEDGIGVEIRGTFSTLGSDDSGQLQGTTSVWKDEKRVIADSGVKIQATLIPLCVDDGLGGWESQMQYEMQVIAEREMSIVAGISFESALEPEPERPTLILCRCGDKTLWELAKETRSTVESIQRVNGLIQEPEPERLLLIPVP